MAKGNKYYWLKLKESFMTSDTVDYMMSLPDGANYVVLYQMLCLKTINTEGRLSRTIGDVIIPYDVSKIQRDTKWFSADTIRVALNLYKSFGLVYEDIDGTLVMSDHHNLVGSETDYAEQKRLQRMRSAGLPESVDNVHTNVHTETRDIERRDRDIDLDRRKPSLSEVEEFIAMNNLSVKARHFYNYFEDQDWTINDEPIRDWQSVLMAWEKRRQNKPQEIDPIVAQVLGAMNET